MTRISDNAVINAKNVPYIHQSKDIDLLHVILDINPIKFEHR
jgi:hypothetical protein